MTNQIFDKLPICAILYETIFCAHGGIPRSSTHFDQIIALNRVIEEPEDESATAWEIFCSDPCAMQQFIEVCEMRQLDPSKQDGFVFNIKRCTAFLFTDEAVNRFLRTFTHSFIHIQTFSPTLFVPMK